MSSLTEDTVPATRRLPIDDSFPKGPNVGELLPDFESVDQSGSKVRFSPNPPKDTDGRREDSGRGWVRELQGRWPGVLG